MNNGLKISIIVPIFKVEPYISATIESLLNQDLTPSEYEIILVNDGSPDNCQMICQNYSDKNKNILLINKENEGVSSARNSGLQLAKGEYVMFVDGDDQIEKNVLKHLYQLTKSFSLDIGLYTMRKENEKTNLNFAISFEKVVTGPDLYLYHREKTIDNSCTTLFRREFLVNHGLFYKEGIPYLEDGEFLVRVMALATRAAMLDFPYLIHSKREGSATAGNLYKSTRAIKGYLIAFENLHSFKSKNTLIGKQLVVVNQGIIKYIARATVCSLFGKSIENLKKVKKSTERLKIGRIEPDGLSSNLAKYALVYNISFYPFIVYAAGKIFLFKLRYIFNYLKNQWFSPLHRRIAMTLNTKGL